MVVAKKRPKSRFAQARAFFLGIYGVSLPIVFLVLSGGLTRPASTAIELGGWIGIVAGLFILLLLPVLWKPLGEDLGRYLRIRHQFIRGWKSILYIAAGFGVMLGILIALSWYAAGEA